MGRWASFGVLMVVACTSTDRDAAPDSAPQMMELSENRGIVEVVGEGVISTYADETFPAEDPRTGDLWFSIIRDSFDEQTILVSRWTVGGWEEPSVAPFSGVWGDRAPRFTPDGSILYFTSNRPRDGGSVEGDLNIWRVERSGAGWSEPRFVETAVNSEAADFHVSVTNRALWVASDRDGGFGAADLYRVDGSGVGSHPAGPLNDDLSQPDLWVSPDESWMILVITDHPSGYGGDDLYISFWEGDGWSPPENLGPDINSTEYEYGPWVSADGSALLFTSHRDGQADVYAVGLDYVNPGR